MRKRTQKLYHIKTYGCQANIADSRRISEVLELLGFKAADAVFGRTDEGASQNEQNEQSESAKLLKLLPKIDVFVVNTCVVRQKSEDKVYGLGKVFLRLAELGGKKPFVVLAGCIIGSAKGVRGRTSFENLKRKTPWADAYIVPSDADGLTAILKKAGLSSGQPISSVSGAKGSELQHAYINVSTGCDNFCTYCVVPYSRGPEVSRPKKEVMCEIERLVLKGVTELTLCGQNVNSWGLSRGEKSLVRVGSSQKLPFVKLLREIHKIKGVKKIDFISSNPFDFTDELIETLKLPKISNRIHIAVQSGNNDVLKRMNRRHTVEQFITLIKKIKAARPNMQVGTDIIVGFPGETRKQFMDSVNLIRKIKFEVVYMAMYSPRKGTTAYEKYEDDVPLKEKKRRLAFLTRVWKASLNSRAI